MLDDDCVFNTFNRMEVHNGTMSAKLSLQSGLLRSNFANAQIFLTTQN